MDYAFREIKRKRRGIDKLRVSFPCWHRFSREFQALQSCSKRTGYFREDYRCCGLPVVLTRPDPRFGSRGVHSLDFIRVGEQNARGILALLARISDADPLDTRIAFADFTADLRGLTVTALWRRVNVRGKRRYREFVAGRVSWDDVPNVQTLYWGTKKYGDQTIIYQKDAEEEDNELPSRGNKKKRERCVRVEHHLAHRHLPQNLRTIGGLLKHGGDYTPFSQVIIEPIGPVHPAELAAWDATGNDRRRVVYTLTLIMARGLTNARRLLAAEHRKPATEIALLKKALSDLRVRDSRIPNLDARYKEDFAAQMGSLRGLGLGRYNAEYSAGGIPY